jgi:hypothetical protein
MKTNPYNKAMELARQADFQFWDGEAWAPELQAIDWSCDYDDQVVELVKLTVLECHQFVGDNTSVQVKKMLDHFGIVQ